MSGISRFFSELKRRNVIRAGTAYLILAWLIVQIVETILPAFGFGAGAIRAAVIILAIGFPLVLAFSWVYEFTPEGLKLETDVRESHSITRHTGKTLDRVIIVTLAVAVSYFAVDKFLLEPVRDASLEAAITEQVRKELLTGSSTGPSIAVLPFVNMSDDPGNEFFADGISEEILNLLAGIRPLRVTSRSSSFSFKERDISVPDIASALNVGHVLEGSVRMSGDSVRVTAQLIEAATDAHVWSETYDRPLSDIFEVQDEIASAVVDKLKVTLVGGLPSRETTTSEAYSLYLQAQYLSSQQTEGSLARAEELLRQSLALDSQFAPAWLALCKDYSNSVLMGALTPDEGLQLAEDACHEALIRNPQIPEIYSELGWLAIQIDNDLNKAAELTQKAWEVGPGNTGPLGATGSMLHQLGRLPESIAIQERLIALDPVSPIANYNLGAAYLHNADFESAKARYVTVLDLSPEFIGGQYALGLAELFLGNHEQALRAFEQETDEIWRAKGQALAYFALGQQDLANDALNELIEFVGDEWRAEVAEVYAYWDEADKAFEWLDTELENPGGWSEWRHNPVFANLHSDPRWTAFLRALGVADEQLAEIEFSVPVAASSF